MNTTPDFETPAYRSVVRLLNLYCLFKMGLFLWHAVPFFAQMFASVEFNPVLFISSFYRRIQLASATPSRLNEKAR